MRVNKFDVIIGKNENFNSYFDENNKTITRLKNASNINIFIGANNSGKSRFIRNLLNYKNFKIENQNLLNERLESFNKLLIDLNLKLLNNPHYADKPRQKEESVNILKISQGTNLDIKSHKSAIERQS